MIDPAADTSSLSASCVTVAVLTVHATPKVPLGAVRSGSTLAIEAAFPALPALVTGVTLTVTLVPAGLVVLAVHDVEVTVSLSSVAPAESSSFTW